jgi:sulfur carrier protein ThiS
MGDMVPENERQSRSLAENDQLSIMPSLRGG